MASKYALLLQRLPPTVRETLPREETGIREIRLCSGAFLGLLTEAGPCLFRDLVITPTLLRESLYGLCGHSLPAYQTQLAQGYFTVEGCRVGVAGRIHYKNGIADGFEKIYALNIRIPLARVPALHPEIAKYIEAGQNGVLIAGKPGAGKTTLLRSVVSYLLGKQYRTVLVDEKQELTPEGTSPSPFFFSYTGCTRADGILYGLRGCNPEFILCDEIAAPQDVAAIKQGIGAGVRFVATIHGANMRDLERRFCYRQLQPGCFGLVVFLGGQPGDLPQFRQIGGT